MVVVTGFSIGFILVLHLVTWSNGQRTEPSTLVTISSADLQRLITKIDNLNLKIDHFESRITQGLETTKLRMELISERIENLEERIPVRVKTEISRDLETKVSQIVRGESRRQYDMNASFLRRLSEEFAEKVFEKVNASIAQMAQGSILPQNTSISKRGRTSSSSSTDGINASKITNMFEEILRNSKMLADKQVESDEALMKFNISLSSLIASNLQSRSTGTSTDNNLSNSVLLEALASFETMSQTMSRRLTELNRSMTERFEIVSLTLNMFLESCFRIQENQPLIEEEIAGLLDRIIDTFHNSTRMSEERIIGLTNDNKCLGQSVPKIIQEYDEEFGQNQGHGQGQGQNQRSIYDTDGENEPNPYSNSPNQNNENENLNLNTTTNSQHIISDEEKLLLWQSLFPSTTSTSSNSNKNISSIINFNFNGNNHTNSSTNSNSNTSRSRNNVNFRPNINNSSLVPD